MTGSKAWWVPLTGVAFFVLLVIAVLVGGEPVSADEPVAEIVDFYVDNKSAVQFGSVIGVLAGVVLIFFGAYLRNVLRAADGEGDILSVVSFVGLVLVALGFAIDGTIFFALAETAEDIDPAAVQALQALWDNDFLPIQLGVLCFLWATGISVIRSGVVAKWIGGAMVVLGIVGLTPIGWVAALGAGLSVLVIAIILALRERSGPASPATPTTPTTPAGPRTP